MAKDRLMTPGAGGSRGIAAVGLTIAVLTVAQYAHLATAHAQIDSLRASTTVVRELTDMRTAESRTYLRSDGSRTTQLFAGPVNYMDTAGNWRSINSRLVPTADGYRNSANSFSVKLPERLEQRDVRFSADGAWLGFSLRGATATAEPSGDRALYEDVLPGVDAVYTSGASALKEELILGSPEATRSFTFDLRPAPGLTPVLDETGAIDVKDARGNVRLHVAAPVMIDAAGLQSDRIDVRLLARRDGWSLTFVPDPAWLDDAERSWPVVIDPIVTLGAERDCTIASEGGADCAGTALTAGGRHVPAIDDVIYWESLLRFDVASAVPAGAEIVSARMALYHNVQGTSGGAVSVHALSQSWDPVGWGSGGARGPAVDTVVASGTGFFYWNLTQLTRDWLAGTVPNHGVALRDGDTSLCCLSRFASSEAPDTSQRPYLEVDYDPLDEANTSIQLAAIDAYMSDTPITASEADRRLRVQGWFGRITDKVTDAIASEDFGGTWIDDNDGGRVKIGIKTTQSVPPESKIASARSVLNGHGFTNADFVSVDWSLWELQVAAASLSDEIPSLVQSGKVTVDVSQSTNTVAVERILSLTSSESATLTAAVADVDVAVDVDVVDLPNLYSTTTAESTCGQIFDSRLACNSPFRGGTLIREVSTGRSCTGGFLGTSRQDGKLYLITAGHCLERPPAYTLRTELWYSYNKSGDSRVIGRPHHGSYAATVGPARLDTGLITVNPPSSLIPSPLWTSDPDRYVFVTSSSNPGADTTRDETYAIRRVRSPSERSIYCTTGAREFTTGRHTVCGRVKKTDTTTRRSGDPLTPWESVIRIDMCGPREGDSGGPLYKNNTGYGIFAGSKDGTCRKFFTRLDHAQVRMNVRVNPSSN